MIFVSADEKESMVFGRAFFWPKGKAMFYVCVKEGR